MEFNGYKPVLTLSETVKIMEREWGLWAEPADGLKIFPWALGFHAGDQKRLFKYTSKDLY